MICIFMNICGYMLTVGSFCEIIEMQLIGDPDPEGFILGVIGIVCVSRNAPGLDWK